MTVLVTGGAGYIGSVLVPVLLESGFSVMVLDTFQYEQSSLLWWCHEPRLRIIRGDARRADIVIPLLQTADVIIPLACLTGAPACEMDQSTALNTNVAAVQMIMAHLSASQQILFPTTNSGYGSTRDDLVCTEETPLHPISHYGLTKKWAEESVMRHPNAISFRLATAFGVSPRMRLDLLVNDFVYRAVTDRSIVIYEPHFIRNYIHVRDVARVFVHGIEHPSEMAHQVYNVGLDDTNLSKKDLALRIRTQLPIC